MSNDIDTIKDKLAKLLRLGEDSAASQGEIENALRIAGAMMAKHSLTRDDIDMEASDPLAKVTYGRHWAFSKCHFATAWESYLANFVMTFMGTVQCYISKDMVVKKNGIVDLTRRAKATGFAFFGPDADAAAATALFEELRDAAATMALVRWGSYWKPDGATYCQGFVAGLSDANTKVKAELMNTDTQTTALMVVAEQNQLALREGSTEWLVKSTGINLGKGRARRGSSGSGSAFAEGRADGANYGVNKPSGRRQLA